MWPLVKRAFDRSVYRRLPANALKRINCRVLVSYNERERIKELYSGATIEQGQTRYSVVKEAEARQQRVTDLLIRK